MKSIMGCVLSAGLGQAPARQAALGAGIPASDPGHHGQQDVRLGHARRDAGGRSDSGRLRPKVVVAGGLESMTNAPYLLPKARAGYRMGHQEVLDHMFFDGLQSPWDGQLMGCFAEATSGQVRVYPPGAGRFRGRVGAARAGRRRQRRVSRPRWRPVTAKTRKGETVIDKDETPSRSMSRRSLRSSPRSRRTAR